MLLNILLLLLVFGAKKKRVSPYLAAGFLGAIKFGLYAVLAKNLPGAVVMGGLFGGMAAALVYFLGGLERRENLERPEVPVYRAAGSERIRFRWEYGPLAVLVILMVWGEMLLM